MHHKVARAIGKEVRSVVERLMLKDSLVKQQGGKANFHKPDTVVIGGAEVANCRAADWNLIKTRCRQYTGKGNEDDWMRSYLAKDPVEPSDKPDGPQRKRRLFFRHVVCRGVLQG